MTVENLAKITVTNGGLHAQHLEAAGVLCYYANMHRLTKLRWGVLVQAETNQG